MNAEQFRGDAFDNEGVLPRGPYKWQFLAEGDSWFTIGTLNAGAATNLLNELEFTRRVAIVSCAYPGDELQQMVQFWKDPRFKRLLSDKRLAVRFDGILLSAGGNDLIAAAQQPLIHQGAPVLPNQRILLSPEEATQKGAGLGPERYISEDGWKNFAKYLNENFRDLLRERDKGINKDTPLFLHTYGVPTVRPCGVALWSNGWLDAAFQTVGIPAGDRQAVSNLLFEKFRQILLDVPKLTPVDDQNSKPFANVYVYDSAANANLIPADPGSRGPSHDWENEIHLTWKGYDKVGKGFGRFIETIL